MQDDSPQIPPAKVDWTQKHATSMESPCPTNVLQLGTRRPAAAASLFHTSTWVASQKASQRPRLPRSDLCRDV